MKLTQRQQSRWQARVRIAGFIVALLILIAGAVILALNSGHSLPAIILTIFGALGVIFAFLQLWPIIFQPKPQQPESEPAPAPQSPSINIYNVLPGAQPAQMTDMPASPDTHLPPVDSPQPASDALTLRAIYAHGRETYSAA